MTAGEYCSRKIVICNREEPVREAVDLMRKYHVGDVIVINQQNGITKPVGIITDRDIVIELVAMNINIDDMLVKDVMTTKLVTVKEDTPIASVIQLMSKKGVRRIPVIAADGSLVGILTTDDLLEVIAQELNGIVSLFSREVIQEQRLRS